MSDVSSIGTKKLAVNFSENSFLGEQGFTIESELWKHSRFASGHNGGDFFLDEKNIKITRGIIEIDSNFIGGFSNYFYCFGTNLNKFSLWEEDFVVREGEGKYDYSIVCGDDVIADIEVGLSGSVLFKSIEFKPTICHYHKDSDYLPCLMFLYGYYKNIISYVNG